MIGLLAGAAIAALIAPGALRAFREAGWTRPNYAGAQLPFPAGVVAVVAAILALGVLAAAERIFDAELLRTGASFLVPFGAVDELNGFRIVPTESETLPADAVVWAPLLLGVAFLGLLDDLFEGAPRGWRGHFGAVLRGGFSTGVLKAVGTLALAAAVLGATALSAGEVLLAVAVIALATNLFNLLDLRPGRSAKGFVLLGAGLLIGTWDADPLKAVGVFAGPLLVVGVVDLRERAMLGDTGSNLIGAIAGVWLVLALGTTGQAIAAGVLFALTVYGEFRSMTTTIERVTALRVLDRLGRP